MAEASLRTRSTGGGLASDRKNGIRMAAGKDHAEACKEYGAGQKKSPERRVMTSMQNLVSQGGAVYFSTGFP